MTSAEKEVASYFAAYEPAIARLGKAVRKKLRARLPGLAEIVYVYENQGSLVISYSPTEQGKDGVCSLAVYAEEVRLYFTQGAKLAKADPQGLLQGRAGVRYVVIGAAKDVDRAEIEALMVAALKLAKVRLDADAEGTVILRTKKK